MRQRTGAQTYNARGCQLAPWNQFAVPIPVKSVWRRIRCSFLAAVAQCRLQAHEASRLWKNSTARGYGSVVRKLCTRSLGPWGLLVPVPSRCDMPRGEPVAGEVVKERWDDEEWCGRDPMAPSHERYVPGRDLGGP